MLNAVTKTLLLLITISVLALSLPAFAGSANDPVSGLPLPPGVIAGNDPPLNITICGKPALAHQLRTCHRCR
jgi:hypothetical protein